MVQKVFLPKKGSIAFKIASDRGEYYLTENVFAEKDNDITNLLCIIKKQLDAIKLIDKDIFLVSYTDIGLNQEINDKSIKGCGFYAQYTTSNNGSAWFSGAKMRHNYSMQVFKNMLDDKGLNITCSVYDEKEESIDKVQVHDNAYDQLVLQMFKKFLMYYISSDQKNVAQVSKCWVGLDKNNKQHDNQLINNQCDSGYEKCALRLSSDYDCTVSKGNTFYRIQDFDYASILELCNNRESFFLKVKDSTNPQQTITMKVVWLEDEFYFYTELKDKDKDSKDKEDKAQIFEATLVDETHPQKFTTMQQIRYFFHHYGAFMPFAFIVFVSALCPCFYYSGMFPLFFKVNNYS